MAYQNHVGAETRRGTAPKQERGKEVPQQALLIMALTTPAVDVPSRGSSLPEEMGVWGEDSAFLRKAGSPSSVSPHPPVRVAREPPSDRCPCAG
jgi:hypothetical protein